MVADPAPGDRAARDGFEEGDQVDDQGEGIGPGEPDDDGFEFWGMIGEGVEAALEEEPAAHDIGEVERDEHDKEEIIDAAGKRLRGNNAAQAEQKEDEWIGQTDEIEESGANGGQPDRRGANFGDKVLPGREFPEGRPGEIGGGGDETGLNKLDAAFGLVADAPA